MGFHHWYVHGPRLIPRLMGSASGATSLLGAETDGLSIDFTDASLIVRDTTTTSNAWTGAHGDVQTFWRDRSFTSYASPSPKITRDSAGLYTFRPHNLIVMSERLQSAAWTATSLTVTDNTVANPLDGTTTAATLALVDASATHQHAATAIAFVTTHRYTFSVYAKANTHSFLQLAFPTGSSTFSANSYANFNLSTGATSAGADATATATDIGNGWYRCSIVSTATASATTAPLIVLVSAIGAARAETHDPNSTNSVYAYGAMVNHGPSALTYTKTQAHNLCLQSQTLDNASWTKNDVTITANSVAAPDGTTTADTFTDSAVNAYHMAQVSTVTVSAGATVTASVYLKQGTLRYAAVAVTDATAKNYAVLFDLQTGTVVGNFTNYASYAAPTSSSITAVGNSWYRCSVTTTLDPAVTTAAMAIAANISGDVGSGWIYVGSSQSLYAWGAQVELASSPGKYVTTTTAAVYSANYDLPREWDSAGACQGLLVEEARTNVLTYSTQFDNAAWTKSNTAASANTTTSPDGTANADTITASAGTNVAIIYQEPTWTAAVYTISVFAKYGTTQYIQIKTWDGAADKYMNFDVQNGTVGTGSGMTGSIQSAGNGWYRLIAVTTTQNAAAGNCVITFSNSSSAGVNPSYAKAGTETLILWQAQLEAGAFITSPIYTGSASVTRAADYVGVSTKTFPEVNTAHTVYTAFTITGHSGANPRIITLSDGTTNEFVTIDSTGSTDARGLVIDGGVTLLSQTSTINATGTANKAALAAELNNGALAANGTANAADTALTMPTVHTLNIGSGAGSNAITGYVRQAMVLPTRKSNANLQTLTT
jgi:hypothetical protein